MDQQIIERLIGIINTLNKVEIKGFENIMNLGLSIQELNNIIQTINQQNQQTKQSAEDKPG